jgi:antitoxin component of MazEF toxin-antitoxin module
MIGPCPGCPFGLLRHSLGRQLTHAIFMFAPISLSMRSCYRWDCAAKRTSTRARRCTYLHMACCSGLSKAMAKLVVRRMGNSVGLSIPRELVHDLELAPGDEVLVTIERIPSYRTLAARLRGKIAADEFTVLSNQGEKVR